MDYEQLGFKCGIEIHQQLDTEEKLFCNCPVQTVDKAADANVERFLKSVAGETGEEDEAAKVESLKSTKFVYNYYKECNCLVELDEEPPHEMNEEALDTGLTFASMVGAEVPQEIQVMRKLVIDGSNTSGFQRTSMIGLDGELETESGTVKIEDIELEEESAGIHERNEDKAIFDLDRLGIPLIEVGTDASIKNAEHAREVAEKIGMLLRSTNKARRGLGTIRQDVNVSIEDGARVEIKGFQDVRNIDSLIELEVQRQKTLVELGEDIDATSEEVEADNVTYIFEDAENEILQTVMGNDGRVYGFKIPDLNGKMKDEISGERYVAKELVDYAKSRGIQGIIHTDEDIEGYNLIEEFDELAEVFNAQEDDVLAVLAGPRENAKQAAKAVRDRAEKLVDGVIPEETRSAETDFTTSYSRPLPGAARMYPETDIKPVRVTDEKLDEIEENIPDTLEEREEKYAEFIGEELASQIVSSRELVTYEKMIEAFEVDEKVAATVFTNIVPQLESGGTKVGELDEEDYRAVFKALEDGEISKGDIPDVLVALIEENGTRDTIIEKVMANKSGDDEVREAVKEVLERESEMIEEQGMRAQGALMGQVMAKVNADGSKVSEILQEELEKRI
ncbi:Glu-tRNA(Gln) amidotransferase subunit GatE [Candidatus Nanohalococcus occultus]|uniref:Glutamyl-tRNA(Gln) amidotransferase subunit E n=1 Tax=Candidatus Nanohalococcus occultus TaxID=2978047 RepID=A0ABY8CF62_9ARCH|nr:Glutamyl-tRNA(Gln) amidotransferase subunit E [Candidatus Nanohaloarchaeota archaeon SVXNc]